MNSTTLRGIFPEPKPIHRKNFLRDNIRSIKEMQGLVPMPHRPLKTQTSKLNKYQNVAPRVYSTITSTRKTASKAEVHRPASFTAQNIPNKNQPTNVRSIFVKSKSEVAQKSIHRGVQTERPEDVPRLYETGVLKYPSPSVVVSKRSPNRGEKPAEKLVKNIQKLDLEEKPNHIKENIKNIKVKPKADESPDRTQLPPSYQRGALPKYLKERKGEELKFAELDKDHCNGLVLLPDDERKEYLRVARENYAALIKELNSMPVSNDTLKKRKRKMEIEDELKRLDEVIKIFQKPKVFVKADV